MYPKKLSVGVPLVIGVTLMQMPTPTSEKQYVDPGFENSTHPLVSTSARQCRMRKDIPGTRPTGRVCKSTDRRENPMTAM